MNETDNMRNLAVYRLERKDRALRILPQLRQQEQILLQQLDNLRRQIAEVEHDAEVNIVKFNR